MHIRNIIILLVVVAVLLGAWWLSTQYPDPSFEPVVGEEGAVPLTPQGTEHYAEETDLYSIDISYPKLANEAAQTRTEKIVAEEAARFKAESVALINEAEAERLRETGRRYELVGEYKAYTSGGFASYVFTIYLDTGGAHPNTFFRTVTFDEMGEEWALEDLFAPGASYLPRLSQEAYTRVLAELGNRTGRGVTPDMEDGVRLGTAPSPEALQFFYLEEGALHLLFPPYQVAAYAAGSFDIAISLSGLRDILKPEVK